MEETQLSTKPFPVSEQMVFVAYQKVKTKGQAYGVDELSIKEFEAKLKGNLYKIWNRLASGTYFPPAVREVEIPKKDGTTRKLGIPTIGDRIAQTVVKDYMESSIDKLFHPNSYGYRPLKSAHQALEMARINVSRYDWVIDMDIKGFFDNISHDLILKALDKVVAENWVKMYCKRWLEMPIQKIDGTIVTKDGKGTPQGGVISPLLANLFLHYAFDMWITNKYPSICFERYADDIIVHCCAQEEAETLLLQITDRMNQCQLELHPLKTKVIYCKDYRRTKAYKQVQFDFLGFSFQPRPTKSKQKGGMYNLFDLSISRSSQKKIVEEINKNKIHKWSTGTIEEIADMLYSKLQGWINYYGRFRKWLFLNVFRRLSFRLMQWVQNKYKLTSINQSYDWLKNCQKAHPNLFAHWRYGFKQ
ncbi:MAG: group II intron reverse transcriptase/maturase [Bacteroidota bacterium]